MTTNKTITTLLFCALTACPAVAQTDVAQIPAELTPAELTTAEGAAATTEEDVISRALEGHELTLTDNICHSLREGWFVEAGLDMTLDNPYGCDFSEVFPKGRTHGLNAAFGKMFSPGIGLRFRMNYENGLPLFRNKRLEWLGPVDAGNNNLSLNMDEGGAMFLYMDVLVSLPDLLTGHRPYRRWDVLLIPRAGLGSNLANSSWSPTVGMGCGCTYRVSRRATLYTDLTYSGITSEYFTDVPGSGTGMGVSTGFCGILSLHAGVRIEMKGMKK